MNRLITAAVALPLIIASIIYPPLELLFVAIAVAAITIALYEFWFLARRVGARPDVVVGYAATAALLVGFFFDAPYVEPRWLVLCVVALTVGSLAAEMLRGAPFDKMILSVGSTLLGVLYVVVLGGHLISVRVGFPRPALGSSSTATSSGRWRSTCSASRATLRPAASATTRKRPPPNDSTTFSVLQPMEPVEPRMAMPCVSMKRVNASSRERNSR